jgi:hypothetical protein
VFIFPVFKQAYYFVVMFFFSFITKEFAFKYLSNQCNKYHIALKKVIDESQYEIFPKNSRAWEAWLSWCNQYQLLMSVANNPVLRENVDMRTCCRESSGCFPLKNIGHQKGCMLLYFRDFSLHGKVCMISLPSAPDQLAWSHSLSWWDFLWWLVADHLRKGLTPSS